MSLWLTPSCSAHRPVGRVLRGKLRLESLLGVGGMAAVYMATHRNGMRCAVKMLHLELSTHEQSRKRSLREGYMANAVGHPGAVAVLDDDVAEEGSVLLVMELLEGQTVDARAASCPGGRARAGRGAGHRRQAAGYPGAGPPKEHRPPRYQARKPVFDRRRAAKLLDFGLASVRDVASAAAASA